MDRGEYLVCELVCDGELGVWQYGYLRVDQLLNGIQLLKACIDKWEILSVKPRGHSAGIVSLAHLELTYGERKGALLLHGGREVLRQSFGLLEHTQERGEGPNGVLDVEAAVVTLRPWIRQLVGPFHITEFALVLLLVAPFLVILGH